MPNEQRAKGSSVGFTLSRVAALRRRAVRDGQRCHWIEGLRQFLAAVESRIEFETILVSDILLKSGTVWRLVAALVAAGVVIYELVRRRG